MIKKLAFSNATLSSTRPSAALRFSFFSRAFDWYSTGRSLGKAINLEIIHAWVEGKKKKKRFAVLSAKFVRQTRI